MAQVPSDVSNLFRKTEGWGSPHTERHVVKVPEVVPSLHLGLSLPYDINSFPFSKYVTLYLKDRHMGITKDAITSPFLPKSSIQDHHESLDIFRLILLYMNDPNLGEERRRIVADFVLQNGLTNEHMRDEILVQLCNQTMGSSKGRKSGDPDTAWTLLANCLGCFAPSPKLTNYLLKYVSDNTSSGFSAICQHKLLQSMSMEMKISRSYPPCLLEWTANKVKACMSLQGIFADGHKIYGHIESWTTGEEFASHLLQCRQVSEETSGWTILLKDITDSYECAGFDFVLDLISEIEIPPSFPCGTAYFITTVDVAKPGGAPLRPSWPEQPHNAERLRLVPLVVDELPEPNSTPASSIAQSPVSSPRAPPLPINGPLAKPENLYASQDEALSQESTLNKRKDKLPDELSRTSALNKRYTLAAEASAHPKDFDSSAAFEPQKRRSDQTRPSDVDPPTAFRNEPKKRASDNMEDFIDDMFGGIHDDMNAFGNPRMMETRIKGGGDEQKQSSAKIGSNFVMSPFGLPASQPVLLPTSPVISSPIGMAPFMPDPAAQMYQQQIYQQQLYQQQLQQQQLQQQQQQQQQMKLQQQTVELQLQLQTKELEKQVLQTTLQTELIKQQLQQVKEQSNAAERQQLKKEPAPPPPAKKYSRTAMATSNAVPLPKQAEPVSNGVDRSKEVKWAKKVQVIEQEPEDAEVRGPSSVKAPPLSPALSKKRVSSPLPPKLPEQDQQVTTNGENEAASFVIVAATSSSTNEVRRPTRMAIKWPPESDTKLEKEPLPPPKRFIIDEKKEQQEKIVPTKSAEEIQRKINEKIKASEPPVEPAPKKAPPPRPYKQKSVEQENGMQSPEPEKTEEYQTLDMKTRTAALSKQLEAVAWGTQKQKSQPVSPPPPMSPRQIAPILPEPDTAFDLHSLDGIRSTLHKPSMDLVYTYSRVPWTLEVRKEVFAPAEKLENPLLINLVYCQIVLDSYADNCIRMSKDDKRKMTSFIEGHGISMRNFTSNHGTNKKKVIIDEARSLPYYFSRMFAVNGGKVLRKVHILAVSHTGVRLLTRFKDVYEDYLDVIDHIRFEQILSVNVPKSSTVLIKTSAKRFVLYTPRSNQICSMIEAFRLEHNVKFDPRNRVGRHQSKAFADSNHSNFNNNNNHFLDSEQGSECDKDSDMFSYTSAGEMHEKFQILSISKQESLRVKLANTTSDVLLTNNSRVKDIIDQLCDQLDIPNDARRREFVLQFESGRLVTALQNNENVFELTQMMKLNLNERCVSFLRGTWIHPLDLDTASPLYIDFMYHQTLQDYLDGYFLAMPSHTLPNHTKDDISILAALQVLADDLPLSEQTVSNVVPRRACFQSDMKVVQWLSGIQSFCRQLQGSRPVRCRTRFLEILSKWPLFGSIFFPIESSSDTRVTNPSILAVHPHGLYSLDSTSHVVLAFYPFKAGLTLPSRLSANNLEFTYCTDRGTKRTVYLHSQKSNNIVSLIKLYIVLLKNFHG